MSLLGDFVVNIILALGSMDSAENSDSKTPSAERVNMGQIRHNQYVQNVRA